MPRSEAPLDLSEFEEEPRMCAFGRALLELSEADQRLFAAALGNERIRNAKIVERLKVRGITASRDRLREHRKGTCCCGK